MQSIQEYLSKRSDTAQLMTISLELEQRMYEAEVAGEGELYHSINASHRSVLPSIIEEVYRTLQLIRFYIVDDKRAHTYVCRHGTTAADAANLVDVYVSRNFIRAEVISFEEYELMAGDRLKLAMEGKIRPQGRKYVFNDGDIVEFVFHTKSETV